MRCHAYAMHPRENQCTYKYIILYIQQQMTATLHDILKYKMINVGDSIEFSFKQHFSELKLSVED